MNILLCFSFLSFFLQANQKEFACVKAVCFSDAVYSQSDVSSDIWEYLCDVRSSKFSKYAKYFRAIITNTNKLDEKSSCTLLVQH